MHILALIKHKNAIFNEKITLWNLKNSRVYVIGAGDSQEEEEDEVWSLSLCILIFFDLCILILWGLIFDLLIGFDTTDD